MKNNTWCFVVGTLWLALPVSSMASRAILVTGANKGQGLALCRRILAEHDDTYVFLGARSQARGEAAVASLEENFQGKRAECVPLDVTDETSVKKAVEQVQSRLKEKDTNGLYGVVSNAGILWGYSLQEQFAVNTAGVCRVLDAFIPLLDPQNGRLIVVSSGLGPLMHGYADAERQKALTSPDLTRQDLSQIMKECLEADSNNALESIGFPGGPFAEAAPDFHKYGLAKALTDAYMLRLSRQFPHLRTYSCDPGLVYTDLILKMPKYEGQSRDETGAKSPEQGVEAAMRLLFTDEGESGGFHAMNKQQTMLLKSTIDVMPKG